MLSSLWCITPMNKRCSLTLIHPASLTAHRALCICLESTRVSEDIRCPTQNSPLIALYGSALLSGWCYLLMQQPRFQLMAVDLVEVGRGDGKSGSGEFCLSLKLKVPKESLRTFMLLNKEHPHKWEKSTTPFKKVISQSLLINQLMKGGGQQLDHSASLTKVQKKKWKITGLMSQDTWVPPRHCLYLCVWANTLHVSLVLNFLFIKTDSIQSNFWVVTQFYDLHPLLDFLLCYSLKHPC